MSMTHLIRNSREIREVFDEFIQKPKFKIEAPYVAPPLAKNPTILGTAFDYFLRFFIQRINEQVITHDWVAEGVAQKIDNVYKNQGSIFIKNARALQSKYLKDGRITEELLIATIRLGHLDVVARAGLHRLNFRQLKSPDHKDVVDLRALISALKEPDFKSARVCYLNPNFGKASWLVQGADADIIIDDRLIDIKASKKVNLETRDLYQLVGYYLLLNLGGVTNADGKQVHHEIKAIGFYYARYGKLIEWPVEQIIPASELRLFAKTFIGTLLEPNMLCPTPKYYNEYVKVITAMREPLAQQVALDLMLAPKKSPRSKTKPARKK